MRCWTVQPVEVFEHIQNHGFARVNPERRHYPYRLPECYLWLSWHMAQRLDLPDEDDRVGIFPWFAYCQRPDLRWVRHSQSGPQVLIEFAPPQERVLAFPTWAWNEIYGGFYLAYSGREYQAWTARFRAAYRVDYREFNGPLPLEFLTELTASWNRLFDPSIPAKSWRRRGTTNREAVVDILDQSWIKKATHFEGIANY